jgi:hypothetical protein
VIVEGEALSEPAAVVGEKPIAPQRLYLHVGLPKSGSTYLQTVLATNREALKECGFAYPFVRQEGMFLAAVEMAGSAHRWGLEADDIDGTFAHLLRRGRRLGGTVVISHEIFGSATLEQIQRMGEHLGDFELHLVVTARDLGRTVTAEWQEQVKNGHTASFDEFAGSLMAGLPDDPAESGAFWPTQNLIGVLGRWGDLVPAERIHVVPCPRSGSPHDLLWQRFAEALELPDGAVDLSTVPARNESLGMGQIALLRQVLDAVDGRLEQPWHSRLAKRWFAQTLLSQARSHRPVAPPAVTDRLAAVSRAWVEEIRSRGYRVHGDLDDLLPETASSEAPHPDAVTDSEMLAGLPQVVAEMLVRTKDLNLELIELRDRARGLTQSNDELAARIASHEVPYGQRLLQWWRGRRR